MALSLTQENYFSKQAGIDYMSASQFKEFAGTTIALPCEETAFLKYKGLIEEEESTALLVGSYVDAYYEGTLTEFINTHPEIMSSRGSTKGELKAEFKQAETIIDRTNRDPLFSEYMAGQKQIIMTFPMLGIDWKIKIDSFHPQTKIVDLKVIKDMKPIWSGKQKVDFAHFWGYDIQGAVYQKGVEIVTGRRLPFYLCVATKEKTTNIEIIEIPQTHLDAAFDFVTENLARVYQIKTGMEIPGRCGICPHCLDTKTLVAPIQLDDLMPKKFGKDQMDIFDIEE